MPFFFIFKHSQAPKRSWKIFHGGPGKFWIFVSKSGNRAKLLSSLLILIDHLNPYRWVHWSNYNTYKIDFRCWL